MTSNAYARRYSQAIFRMALESKDMNRWQSDLRKIASLMRDRALFSLIAHPKVTVNEKSKTLSQRLGDVNPLAIKLVLLLAAKGRLALIDDIAEEYQVLVDNYRGIEGTEIAEVTTAIPLDKEDTERLSHHLEAIIGGRVSLNLQVNPDILGGFIARIGDSLIDGSIRNKLNELRKSLAETKG